MAEKILFRNEKFLGKKIRKNTSIPMDLSKNNGFLTEEAINFIAGTEKRKRVPVCEIRESAAIYVLFYHGNWREAGLELLYDLSSFVNKVITSWYYPVTKSFIIDDVGVRDPPLVCQFSVQNITKKIKI